jgi:DNA-binding transcriptional ArsR family regulator
MLRKPTVLDLPDLALDALGNAERREILRKLAAGPLSVGDLAEQFPISRPAVSRHLRVLEEAGLVHHASEGTRNIYGLDRAGLDETARGLSQFWDEAEARLRLVAENTEPRRRSRG